MATRNDDKSVMQPIGLSFNEVMKEVQAQATFEEFSKLHDFALKFGNEALKKRLRAQPSATNELTEKQIFELLSRGVTNYSAKFNEELNLLQQRLAVEHKPRAVPAEKQRLDQTLKGPNQAENYLQVPWLKNMVDEAADPKVRQAVEQAARNISKDPSKFTENYNNVRKAAAEYLYKLRNRPTMRPSPGYRPKPQK